MILQTPAVLFLALFLVCATALPALAFTLSLVTEPITTNSISSSTTTPSPTLPITTTWTSSSSSYIASNTAVPDCNFEGLPSTLIINYTITDLYAPTPLACQTACEDITDYITTVNGTVISGSCLSYSFRAPANLYYGNCELFSVPFTEEVDGIELVVKDSLYGMYYSNRWPADGSGFCYS